MRTIGLQQQTTHMDFIVRHSDILLARTVPPLTCYTQRMERGLFRTIEAAQKGKRRGPTPTELAQIRKAEHEREMNEIWWPLRPLYRRWLRHLDWTFGVPPSLSVPRETGHQK